MNLMFWRPRPQFSCGSIVALQTGEYVLIKNRRWVRPNGQERKCWVYDGVVLDSFEKEVIDASSGIYCVLESHIERIVVD